jgi:hypothetical protein
VKDSKTRVTIMMPVNLEHWARNAARYNHMTKSELISEAVDRYRRESMQANERRFNDEGH